MKLLNKSLLYLSISLVFIIGIWFLFSYFNMLRTIKDSIDEGLDNYKRQIVYLAEKDSSIVTKANFNEGFFAIQEITPAMALSVKDTYSDTIMFMQDADDPQPELEPTRMLRTAFENNGKYYELKIINSIMEEDDLIKALAYDAIWLYLTLLTSLIVLNNFVLKRLWKPFYAFLNQLKEYQIGSEQKFPKTVTKTKEFNDLENAVGILLQHNKETYEQQKEFIGNASHELQTPLAIVSNKLELLIEKGSLQPEQAEDIAEVMQMIERLVRLNKSLLLLTKIENKQFIESQSVVMNEIVQQCVQDIEDVADFKEVRIEITESASLIVSMNASLATIVMANLIRNALFHNIPKGDVKIKINENSVQISNSGTANPLKEEKIFARFYTTEGHQKGSGLGLAIVKAICDTYGFSLKYLFKENYHCFSIYFSSDSNCEK